MVSQVILLPVSFFFAVSMSNAASTPIEVCEAAHPFARYFRGHCFIAGDDKATWGEAKEKCNTFRNGHLAIASSPKLADYIARNILTPHGYDDSWIGLKQSEDPLGQWFWYHNTHDYGQPTAIPDRNFTGNNSNDKCVTVGRNSPRLKNANCNMTRNYVCQYTLGDQRFRQLKNMVNKKASNSSAGISIQTPLEEHCATVCGMTPALSLAFNPTTRHCQIHLEFADELELVDAPGYNVWQKVGQDSKPLGCTAAEADPCLLENTVAKLNDSSDFSAIGSYDMTCVEGYYLTEEKPSDGEWYTTYTPPTLVCKVDGTWGVEKGGKNFKCLPIPETFPIYRHYIGGSCRCHRFSTVNKGRGIIFYAIQSTAYCPEKRRLFWVLGTFLGGNQDFIYTATKGEALIIANSYAQFTYRGAWDGAYVVPKQGQCGATGLVYRYRHSGHDHMYSLGKIKTGVPPWALDGLGWYAWRE